MARPSASATTAPASAQCEVSAAATTAKHAARIGMSPDEYTAHRAAVKARIDERKKSILYGWDDDVTRVEVAA